jgi:ankyrin repeat protein
MTVVRGHLDIIKTLIVSGASVNACNYRGQTPLHFAVAYDNIEIVQLLTEFGADYFAKDNDGYMPIDYAKFYQSQNVLDFVNDHSLIEIEDQEVKIRRELHPNNNLIVDYFNEDD